MINTKKFVEVCLPLMARSWQLIEKVHKGEPFNYDGDVVEWKSKTDPVTIADFSAQYILQTGIEKEFPGLKVIGEEEPHKLLKTDFDFGVTSRVKINNPDFEPLNYDVKDCCVWIGIFFHTILISKKK